MPAVMHIPYISRNYTVSQTKNCASFTLWVLLCE